MITLTGFDRGTFDSLCVIFASVFDSYTPFVPPGTSCFGRRKQPKRGRPRMIRPEDCLGLVFSHLSPMLDSSSSSWRSCCQSCHQETNPE
jgi:hypothetical protein